jgi:hypothetical protein
MVVHVAVMNFFGVESAYRQQTINRLIVENSVTVL